MERWSGPFPTPNVAGLELALLATAVLAVAARPWPALGRLAIPARILAVMAGAAAIAGLAGTGSRAGGLALATGLATLGALRLMPWRWAAAGVAASALAFIGSGFGERFVPDPGERSMGDRFVLWRASLALIADHPWRGVGTELQEMLAAWYLPGGMRLRFATALNDALTCAARWGLPVLGLCAGAATLLLVRAGRRALAGDLVAGLAVALLAVHAVAGLFQAHLFAPWEIARLSAGLVLAALAWSALRPAPGWRRPALIAGAAAVLVPSAIAGLAAGNAEAPWRTHRAAGLVIAQPRHAPARGLVVAVHPPEERARLVEEFAPLLHADGLAVALTSRIPDSPPAWPGPTLLLAARDRGAQAWQTWQDGRLGPASLVVLDPDAPPATGGIATTGPRGPLLVLAPAGSAIPSPASLRAAVAAGRQWAPATIADIAPGASWSDAWIQVRAWRSQPPAPGMPDKQSARHP